ncbi:MAG: transcriptional regulator [Alphaproteobacteria bacterium RIFCSPHIGHO2_12_FULL_63_12]|nr:MAG: transcriptional regulator [Alphaproteobacteria bacterium RIFCSPHIGHO2_12_FULL_63_12]
MPHLHNSAHETENRRKIVNRLRRIEGQVAGLARMVEDNRYCIDILTQVQAVKSALSKVEDAILSDHAAHCVAAAIKSGDADDQRAKFSELVDLIGKVKR